MANPSDPAAGNVCPACGTQLRPQARFCPNCGTRVAQGQSPPPAQAPGSGDGADTLKTGEPISQPTEPALASEAAPAPPTADTAEPIAVEAAPPATAPGEPGPAPSAPAEPAPSGYQVTLQSAGPARARVLQVLRQMLGLNPRDAQAYVAAAPVLLAVGLTEAMAESLRAALVAAGAVALVQGPPPTKKVAPIVEEPAPEVEPIRRLALGARVLRQVATRPGLRTVTGLNLGQTCSYLAYARAEGNELAALPELVRIEARTAVPTAVRPVASGQSHAFGAAALAHWPRQPQLVHLGFLEALGQDDGSAAAATRSFLEALARRLSDVVGANALSASEGAATTLGVPAAWDDKRANLLADIATAASFPVIRIAPEPLAALAHHEQQGALRPPRKREEVMVIDWGGQALRLSFLERGGLGGDGQTAEPLVFEHLDLPLGGDWFDAALLERIREQLPSELTEDDQRALVLFARDFKEQLSRSFAEGRREHVQYCVIPAGAPPTRIRLSRADFEALSSEAREQFQSALSEAVAGIGLKPEHIEHVILVGGGGRWYFARESIRTTLGRVPYIGPHPEEVIARGLAVYGLK